MVTNSTGSFARLELANRKEELAEPLRQAFLASGMSQVMLGDVLGVSVYTISKISRNRISGVSLDKLYLLAVSLGLSVNMKIVNVNQ